MICNKRIKDYVKSFFFFFDIVVCNYFKVILLILIDLMMRKFFEVCLILIDMNNFDGFWVDD